jgi:hypothetical protein
MKEGLAARSSQTLSPLQPRRPAGGGGRRAASGVWDGWVPVGAPCYNGTKPRERSVGCSLRQIPDRHVQPAIEIDEATIRLGGAAGNT